MTQKDPAEKLNISFQAVSKWENGDTLPDTGILLDLCDILNTTADKLLNGGSIVATERKLMRLEDVITGFQYIENIRNLFGATLPKQTEIRCQQYESSCFQVFEGYKKLFKSPLLQESPPVFRCLSGPVHIGLS
ncbi:MAG: helix-turn-helix transcriptional regulator [Lachnospiraceae bacterium]|nr:helix-turn-helix transcriptional regulator [Lachnospiraceae bacterium]